MVLRGFVRYVRNVGILYTNQKNTAKNAGLRCRLMISNVFYIAQVIYVELTNGHGTFQTRWIT